MSVVNKAVLMALGAFAFVELGEARGPGTKDSLGIPDMARLGLPEYFPIWLGVSYLSK